MKRLLRVQAVARCPAALAGIARRFNVPLRAKGKLVFIEFDGVYRNSEVWINGHYLGKRPYGYSTFEYELTPHLVYGAKPNVIAVKVDNSQQPNSRWYSGSGIYRNVWLTDTRSGSHRTLGHVCDHAGSQRTVSDCRGQDESE